MRVLGLLLLALLLLGAHALWNPLASFFPIRDTNEAAEAFVKRTRGQGHSPAALSADAMTRLHGRLETMCVADCTSDVADGQFDGDCAARCAELLTGGRGATTPAEVQRWFSQVLERSNPAQRFHASLKDAGTRKVKQVVGAMARQSKMQQRMKEEL